jgi:phosphoglycerate dehydrogenase-like enzyme
MLFCTDTFAAHGRERIAAVAPGLPIVELVATAAGGNEQVVDDDLDRISIAYFSTDAWPDRAPAFMTVALSAPNLRWLHTMSAGVDHPIFTMLTDRGVAVTTSSGSSASPIASTVMMYLLALSRDLPRSLRAQAAHEWDWRRWDDLEGRRIAVLGFGPIGQEVVRLATAFGMRPTVVRRRAHGDEPCPVAPIDDLRAVVADHDAVVCALPLTADTAGVVSADVIAAMRPGARFVNVGRGEVVDQAALTDALRSGHLGGAALDVFAQEPLPADDPIWDAPNLIITPHNSGASDTTAARADEAFLANLSRWVAGEPLANQV